MKSTTWCKASIILFKSSTNNSTGYSAMSVNSTNVESSNIGYTFCSYAGVNTALNNSRLTTLDKISNTACKFSLEINASFSIVKSISNNPKYVVTPKFSTNTSSTISIIS